MFNADDKYDVYSGGFCDVFTLQDIKDRDLIFQVLFHKHKSIFDKKIRLKNLGAHQFCFAVGSFDSECSSGRLKRSGPSAASCYSHFR